MAFVVPDAIEPVVGWRCFDIVDGLLVSPQQRMPWPPSAHAKAICGNERWHYEWMEATWEQIAALEEKARADGFEAATGHYVKFLMPDGDVQEVPVYMPWGFRGSVPPVTHYPEEGTAWTLTVVTHSHPAPSEGCSCGIHIAREIDLALQYQGHGKNLAIGVVKGWGKVIPAHRGFRVEFAYPDRLYLFKPPEGDLDLSPYGVPLASVLECDEYLASIGVEWR